MKMVNLFFLIVLGFAIHSKAEGPLYKQKDTYTQQEFDNVYRDLRGKLSLTGIFNSTNTWTANQSFSSMTVNNLTANNATSSGTITANNFSQSYSDSDPVANDTTGLRLSNLNSGNNSAVMIVGSIAGTRRIRWYTMVAGGGGGVSTFQIRDVDNTTWDTVFIASNTGAIWLQGTKTNDNAAPGGYGEKFSSTTSNGAVGPSTQYYDIASTAPTAGDWLCWGTCYFTRNGATYSSEGLECGIGTTTGNSAAGIILGDTDTNVDDASISDTFSSFSMNTPVVAKSFSATTSVFLKGYAGTYSAGSPLVRGKLLCVRDR